MYRFTQPRGCLPDCVWTEHGRLYSTDMLLYRHGAVCCLGVVVPSGEALMCTGGVHLCVQILYQFTQGPECPGSIHGEAAKTQMYRTAQTVLPLCFLFLLRP